MVGQAAAADQASNRDERLFIDAIEKCFIVLEAFGARTPAMSIAQLSTKTGLGRSATQRIVYTLTKLGYLQREKGTKRFSLSPKSLGLGSRYVATDSLIDLAQPFLREIAERFDETVTLARLERRDIVIVSQAASTQVISAHVPVGARYPVEGSASGWVLLAYLPEPLQSETIAGLRFRKSTPQNLRTNKQFMEELERVRIQGFSLIEPPLFVGGISLAVPVLDIDGHASAALAVSCPSARWPLKSANDLIAPALMSAGHALSRLNGWHGDAG